MVISTDELERLADDIYKDRRITGSVYCGECGYNLKTLPYIHVCPECGNDYNARPRKMVGIFKPHEAEIPARDVFMGLLCGLCCFILAWGAIQPLDPGRLAIAAVFLVLTILNGGQACSKLARWIRSASVMRRIVADEAEFDV